MSTPSEHAARSKANELYWNTDDPVRTIADKVGMSRSAVYAAIEPLPTGVASPTGDADLVFTTRTNRETGVATCPSTGTEHQLDQVIEAGSRRDEALPEMPAGETAALRETGGAELVRDWVTRSDPEKMAFGAVMAAVGVVLGLIAGRIFRG